MSEKTIRASDIKRKEEQQAIQALISTTAPLGDERRYHALDTSLSEYNLDLFGREAALENLVKIGLSRKKGEPFRILVLGAGTGKMARELVAKMLNPDNLYIDELSMGDSRTLEQKKYDRENNIKFIQGDIGAINLEDSSYDLVVSRMFLLHMIDPLRVIKKVARSMKEGGEFYADFRLTRDLVPRFTGTKEGAERKASKAIENARENGSIIFIDDTGLLYKKNKERLRFGNLTYKKDEKGRIYYET